MFSDCTCRSTDGACWKVCSQWYADCGIYSYVCLQSAYPLYVMASLTATAWWITSASMSGSFWWVFHSTCSHLSFLDDLHLCEPVFSKVTGVLKCPFPDLAPLCPPPLVPVQKKLPSVALARAALDGSELPLQFASRKVVAKSFTSVRLSVTVTHISYSSSFKDTETWGHRMGKPVKWPCVGHA